MPLLTLLGVIALLLRERRANNAHSDQDEEGDQNDVPPVRISDGREIDDWGDDTSLEEPSDGQSGEPPQEEPADDQGEEPSKEEPVDGQKEPSQEEPDDGQTKPPQGEPVDGQKEPSQEEPVDGQTKPPEEEPVDGQKEPSQEEPVGGQTKPPQEKPADDQDEEPSQEEPVAGQTKPPQEEPVDGQKEPSQEEPVDGQTKPPQEEPDDGQTKPPQGEPVDGQKEPSQEEPVDGQTKPSQEEPVGGQTKPPQEEPADDQNEEPSQEEPVAGQTKPPQEEPVDGQKEPSQEEPVDGQTKPPQEEPDDGQTKPPQGEPVDGQKEPSQEEPVDGQTKPPQEEPVDGQKEPSQKEPVGGQTKPPQEEPADDQDEEPSQEEPVAGQTKPPQEEPADDQDEEPSQEEPVAGQTKPPQEEPVDGQKEPSQEEPVDGQTKPPQEEPDDGQTKPPQGEPVDGQKEPSQEEPVDGQTKPPQEEPVDGQKEPSQEEPVGGQTKPPQEEPADDQDEEPSQEEPVAGQTKPPQEEPVDGQKEPSQEEPVDGQTKPPQGKSDVPPECISTRSSSSSVFNSASCHCGSSKDNTPQGSTRQKEDPVPPRLKQLKDETINVVEKLPQEEPDVPPECISTRSSSSSVFNSASCHCGSSKDNTPQGSTRQKEDPVPPRLKQLKKDETINVVEKLPQEEPDVPPECISTRSSSSSVFNSASCHCGSSKDNTPQGSTRQKEDPVSPRLKQLKDETINVVEKLPQEEPDVPPVFNPTRSSSSSVFNSASCHCGSSKDSVPQGSTRQKEGPVPPRLKQLKDKTINVVEKLPQEEPDVPPECNPNKSSSSSVFHSVRSYCGISKDNVPQGLTKQKEDPVPPRLKQLKKDETINVVEKLPQEEPVIHPECNPTRSSSVFYSAMFDCDSRKDNVPQGSTQQKEDPVSPWLKQQEEDKPIRALINSRRYEISAKLGEGGFGTVFAGTRLEDGLRVAIKISPYPKEFITLDGFDKPLPAEIALHFLATQGPKVKEIIELLDWQVFPKRYIMVLEHPVPCQSLYTYWNDYNGNMKEDKVRRIMYQVTIAAQTCCQRKVFHRDIKLQNLLINPDTLEVKLIDFGCGELLNNAGYSKYCGTKKFQPPEYIMFKRYYGEPATVWSLGIVMYLLIYRQYPELRDLQRISHRNLRIRNFSKDCCNFIQSCLEWEFEHRIKLQKLRLHNWFKVEDKNE